MNTTAMPYRARVGTLPARVIDWLKANPGEELSAADIGLKWDTSPSTAAAGLESAVKNRGLVMVRNSDHVWVYRLPAETGTPAPTQAPAWPAPATATPAAPAAPAPAPAPAVLAKPSGNRGGRQQVVAVSLDDIAALPVEHGIPIAPAASKKRGASKWAPLVNKLGKAGDSVEFPAAWRGALAAYVSQINCDARKAGRATHYVVRATSADKARIWRKA